LQWRDKNDWRERKNGRMAAIGELASGIAHEIRNPLAIISTSAQYLQGKLVPSDPKREFTKVIKTSPISCLKCLLPTIKLLT